MGNSLTEHSYQAHRLHQYRVEARLTIADAAERAGITEAHWFAIEYRRAGTVAEIKKLIALFVPSERRMRYVARETQEGIS